MRQNSVIRFAMEKLFGSHLEFRVRLFNILAMAGCLLSVYAAITSIYEAWPVNWGYVIICLLAAGFSVGLMCFATKTGRYELCYIITIALIFFGLFPVMFFMDGGYDGSKPYMFILAILFTVFMLKGKKALVLAVTEILFYSGLFVVAFLRPERVTPFINERAQFLDVLLGFLFISTALAVCFYLHFRLHNKQQEQLARQNAELDGINKMKTQFLQDIKHEIRTPLTSISLGTEVALNNTGAAGDERKARRALVTVQNTALRLGSMIEGMVELANMSEKPRNRERIDFAAMLKNRAEAERFEIESKHNTLRVEIAPGLPYIYAEAEQIERVPANLLDNAAHFTEDGEITVEATAEGNFIMVRVRDTGAGISSELLPRVFERGVSGRGGDGYGLSYCKTIVEAHGGVIGIESGQGKGTVVTFTVPVYGGQDYRAGQGGE